MEVSELLNELERLLEQEKELLLKFPITSPEQILEIQEKVRKILYELSKFPKETLLSETERLVKLSELNARVSSLVLNQLSFLEELEREIFGELLTYEKKSRDNLFDGKA